MYDMQCWPKKSALSGVYGVRHQHTKERNNVVTLLPLNYTASPGDFFQVQQGKKEKKKKKRKRKKKKEKKERKEEDYPLARHTSTRTIWR